MGTLARKGNAAGKMQRMGFCANCNVGMGGCKASVCTIMQASAFYPNIIGFVPLCQLRFVGVVVPADTGSSKGSRSSCRFLRALHPVSGSTFAGRIAATCSCCFSRLLRIRCEYLRRHRLDKIV